MVLMLCQHRKWRKIVLQGLALVFRTKVGGWDHQHGNEQPYLPLVDPSLDRT